MVLMILRTVAAVDTEERSLRRCLSKFAKFTEEKEFEVKGIARVDGGGDGGHGRQS